MLSDSTIAAMSPAMLQAGGVVANVNGRDVICCMLCEDAMMDVYYHADTVLVGALS